jgi:hypothetical protein
MGRYYIEHEEIMKLYITLLQDLNIYNCYIKEFIRISVKKKQEIDE